MSNCPKCGFRNTKRVGGPNHSRTCEDIDLDSAKWYLNYHNKGVLRECHWLSCYQRAVGKIALLKHENNKLRAANNKAKALIAAETDRLQRKSL